MHPPVQPSANAPRATAARALTQPLPWMVAALVLLAVALWRGERTPNGEPPARADAVGVPESTVQWRRFLQFEDRPNGDVVVIDARSGREVARYQGEQGFLRGTLRAFARERARRQIGPQQPLELIAHDQGRLSLVDPATGQRIALESFGASNLAVFAALRDSSGHDGRTLTSPRSEP
ncbi:MAG: photosynthetic complex assembly protein PuhC [Burkholderiaceae bacterium]